MAEDTEKFVQLEADKEFVYRIDGEHKTFEKGEKFSAQHGLAITLLNQVGAVSKTGKTHTVEEPESRIVTVDKQFDKETEKDEKEGYGYRELQEKAKQHDIPANQSEEELKNQLEEKNVL